MTSSRSINWWLTRFAWIILLLNIILVLFLPERVLRFSLLVWVLAVWLLLTFFLIATWFSFTYRSFFQTGAGWLLAISVAIIALFVVTGNPDSLPSRLSFLFSMLALPGLWLMFLATLILLWRRDKGLLLVGGLPLLFVWSAFLTWQYQGNLIELWLESLNQPTAPSPLWWLNSLFCLSACLLPLAMLSFVGHSLRLLVNEFRDSHDLSPMERTDRSE